MSSLAVFGGVRIEPQIAALENGVDVLITTPGRLMDLYQQGAVNFELLSLLVLDEADRMLDLGFIGDIKKNDTSQNMEAKQLSLHQTAFGYTKEDISFFLNPIY